MMDINKSNEDVLSIVKKSIEEKTPFLLTRYGEGESRIFHRRFGGGGGTDWIIKNLIGYVPDDVDRIVEEMELALVNSDITGLPGKSEISFMNSEGHSLYKDIYSHFRNIFDRRGIEEDSIGYCSVNIHSTFDFDRLLTGMDEVQIITCRDVSEKMKSYFGIGKIKHYKIPPEYKYEHDKNIDWNFYPEVHDSIRDEILSQDNRGKLLLYGAGALGKDLGFYFKKSGGVAFDIGSIFDRWYGKKTRGAGKGTDSYFESPLNRKN